MRFYLLINLNMNIGYIFHMDIIIVSKLFEDKCVGVDEDH